MTNWSDAPIVTRDGSRFVPKQPISPQRRADVADSLRAMGRSDRTAEKRAEMYEEWRAKRKAGAG